MWIVINLLEDCYGVHKNITDGFDTKANFIKKVFI